MKTEKRWIAQVCVGTVLLLCMSVSAPGDVIVDNGDSGTSFTGTWEVSGGSDPYGADSVWARDGATYTWGFDSEPAGKYEVLMRWSVWPSRAKAIDVSIMHADGTDALLINQQVGGGVWNSMGEYNFDGSGSVTITAAAGQTVSTCADAVWFKRMDVAEGTVVDNGDSNTSRTGTWQVSDGSGPYGADSVWSRDGGTFTWYYTPPRTGDYEVEMWWTPWPSRRSSVPLDVIHADGTQRITVDQRSNGSRWNSLGVYTLTGGVQASVTLLAEGSAPASYCADAVKFTLVYTDEAPVAAIDSVQPNPAMRGAAIAFEGHGTDSDGDIVAYHWASSLDGHLSEAASFSSETLSEGVHEITLKVQDDRGQWSAPVTTVLTVSATPVEIIVDNSDANTSRTGTWQVSAGSECYGEDSLWSRSGATFVWYFTPAEGGEYEVAMWWTQYNSRSAAVPVDIKHAGGKVRVTVNQLTNGGRWNSLGVYAFDRGVRYAVTLYADDVFPTSYCADAVRFTPVQISDKPVAVIDSMQPNPAMVGQAVTFQGHGADSDGDVVAYNWQSSLDGHLSDADSFSTSALSEGVHQISFKVCDDGGQWSQTMVKALTVSAAPDVIIIDNGSSATSKTGTWEVSGGSDPYGADSVWSRDGGTFTWHFTPPTTGDYEVSMWWTEWFSRSNSVPVDIVHADGTERVVVNQRTNTGRWNSLGVYPFVAGVDKAVTLTANGTTPISYCADAVKVTLVKSNKMPVAVIETMQPNPAPLGATVSFDGRGTDSDGTVVAYRWASSIDGELSDAASFSSDALSEGVHEITFEVQDDAGGWSRTANGVLTVNAVPIETIVDNRSSNTSSTGTWEVSGGSHCHDVDSVWSRNGGTFTWYFTPSESGDYEVSMWWTEWPSRSRAVKVDIVHAGGTKSVTVNQWIDGSQWNSLGVYTFSEGVQHSITLHAPDAFPTSYCADAVKFTKVPEPAATGS
ncbi:MAG: hypothetical protein IH624_07050 [Phycisphaerae bacterium]|nr:hypothetical protein [Phycisphaerae bacterium]